MSYQGFDKHPGIPDLQELRLFHQNASDHLHEVRAEAAKEIQKAEVNLTYWRDLLLSAERQALRERNIAKGAPHG